MPGWRTSLRARVARGLVAAPLVRVVDPLTRRRVRHLGITVRTDHPAFSPYTRAELFWNLYERTEVTFIHRFLRASDQVLELGAGLGIASAHIAAGMSRGGRLVCVEANPAVIPPVERNVTPHARRAGVDVAVVNAAVADAAGSAALRVQSNLFESFLEGATERPPGGGRVIVPTETLQSLSDQHGFERYDLVCDVEGAEGAFILGEDAGLERCERLVIELHDCVVAGTAHEPADLLQALRERWGFTVLASKGDVVALSRGA